MNILIQRIVVLSFVAFLSASLSACSADCGWNGRAEAFIDMNADGIRGSGEPALAGVVVHVEDTLGQTGYGGRPETPSDGRASLNFFIPCNENIEFVVLAEAPPGYELTTPGRVELGSESEKTAIFGFRARK